MNREHYLEDEDRWVEKIRQGDHSAFEALFKIYYLPLTRFAWRFVQEESLAEELVQEVFAWAWENRQQLHITGKIRSYLYKAVKNQSLNYIKRHKLRVEYTTQWVEHQDLIATPAFEVVESEELRHKELREIVGKAIEELPPRSKMTFKLHRFDGLTYQEISDVMNISVKTVESQMTRTLKILRTRLDDVILLMVALLSIG